MGAALFTTLRATRGRMRFWREHVARLRAGDPDLDPDALLAGIAAATRDLEDARVRVTVRPPEPPLIEARVYEEPSRPWRLQPVTVSLAGDAPLQKTTMRSRYEEARGAAGEADDALLVGPGGEILETTIANIFFFLPGGEVRTPPAAGILPGIVRAHLLRVAKESPLRMEDAARATACVVTNALMLVHPVVSIDGVGRYDSAGLARDLRERVARMAPDLRIIRR